jgi:ABC-type antimicrobial peptide transport system permease subunit
VGHVHRSGPTQESEPQLYVPFAQHVETTVSLVLRTNGDPGALAGPIRGVVRTHDPDLPTAQLQTLNELVTNATARQRFNMLMLTVFALVALGLASVGLYGVMSYLVSQRNREIGIRIALGGQPADVRRLVLRESLWISVGGLVAGAAASLALSRLLTGLLYGIKPIDVPTYAGIGALLLTVAALASYGPARRATRVDPLVALRE